MVLSNSVLQLFLAFAVVVSNFNLIGAVSDELLIKVEADKCTSIVVGAEAGTTGPMATHLSDCADCDFRLNKVPAQDWPENSMRPLYLYKGNYPSTLSSRRGKTWDPTNLEGNLQQLTEWGTESVITGYVPQVKHTYALYEAGYAIMNEHQVAIGESTCASKLWAAPVTAGGKARIEVREMSMIALERSTTAREAIQIMGDLATLYGFYAADWSGGDASKGEGGEGLTVADKTEAWVFHVTADDTGASAVWVAQRLEPDHVSVIANQFIIREVDPNQPDKFMFSDNLWEVATRAGFWSPSADGTKLLDFLLTYAPKRAHSPYATRRVWRVFNLVAPSLILPADTDAYASNYPFSVKAAKPLSPQDVMEIQRDHYEGSAFDLTKGLAAGPYGDPNRFDLTTVDNMSFPQMIQGSYERSISLFRTSYSFVAQPRKNVPDVLGLLWFGQYAPSSCSYTPMYVASEAVPLPYSRGSLFKYDSNIAFWNFAAAGNYAARFYRYAMQDVKALQVQLMTSALAKLQTLETTLLQTANTVSGNGAAVLDNTVVKAALTAFTYAEAEVTTAAWRNLLPQLITKYHDGYIAGNLDGSAIKMKKLFYPKSWLDATGFWNNKPNTGEDVIMFASGPNSTYTNSDVLSLMMGMMVVTSLVTAFLTMYGMRYYTQQKKLAGREWQRSSAANSRSSSAFSLDGLTDHQEEEEQHGDQLEMTRSVSHMKAAGWKMTTLPTIVASSAKASRPQLKQQQEQYYGGYQAVPDNATV